jgi:hypothetical protein
LYQSLHIHPTRAAALSLISGLPALAAASVEALIFFRPHAEKKLVHTSLLVLNHIEACVKANVLKSQHATQATCQMLGLNQIPDSNPNKTNKPTTTDSNF